MAALKKQLPLLLALLPVMPLAAQQDEPLVEDAEEIRRYQVEMIVFRYNEDVSAGTEQFIPDPPPEPIEEFVFGDGFDIALETGDVPPEELTAEELPTEELPAEEFAEDDAELIDDEEASRYAFVMLTGDQFTMLDAWDHLERLDVYEPVMHFGWTQPTLAEADTEARPLASFAAPPEGLDGELKLYLGRYLHLVVDLALAAPEELPAAITPYSPYQVPASTAERQPTYYRIQEDRIFKSGDIRYFDHPKFGVLAKITRVEVEEPGEELEEFLGEPELFDG